MPIPTSDTAGIPVFLLKTKSSPADAYEEYFRQNHEPVRFDPQFVPVIDHTFYTDGVDQLRTLFLKQQIGGHEAAAYGGLIFTSQRSVEAFSIVVQGLKGT